MVDINAYGSPMFEIRPSNTTPFDLSLVMCLLCMYSRALRVLLSVSADGTEDGSETASDKTYTPNQLFLS